MSQHSRHLDPEEQTDEHAVEAFALLMKRKLAESRAKGRAGWHDPALCPLDDLRVLFAGHIGKRNPGNWVDLANIAMMIHLREHWEGEVTFGPQLGGDEVRAARESLLQLLHLPDGELGPQARALARKAYAATVPPPAPSAAPDADLTVI